MALLLGTAPNQVPTNSDLGTMAFQDASQYQTTSTVTAAIAAAKAKALAMSLIFGG